MSHQSAPGSGFVVPNRESRPRDKINSVSTANKVAQSPLIFNLWASTVSLAPPDEVPLDVLPSTLQALVDTSKIIPSWTRNTQASQYSYIPPQFSYQIPAFSGALGASFTTSDDQGLSKDVEDALSLIFQGVKFMTQLRQHPITRLNKADRRLGVNFLASHVWSFSNDESLIHKLECAVQLPHSTASPVEEARPNSAVFFQLKASTLACLPALHFLPYSSMAPRQSSVSGYVLHWVTEYKRDDYAGASKRRAWMAMTSGLYQRRSLGFKDHFVFGTAHDSNTSLTVFAGKWENRAGREQVIA
ncbi:hypothetical protein FRC10_011509 [Ceratobasidium sp. 414]|nr:hypothetical protein FRC10_011509 [Ceratobasidium sp. 414]